MKQKDIMLIAVVAIVAGVISILLSNFLIATPDSLSTEVETVPSITADFNTPEKKYFNEDSINMTQIIRIQENENTSPFTGQAGDEETIE